MPHFPSLKFYLHTYVFTAPVLVRYSVLDMTGLVFLNIKCSAAQRGLLKEPYFNIPSLPVTLNSQTLCGYFIPILDTIYRWNFLWVSSSQIMTKKIIISCKISTYILGLFLSCCYNLNDPISIHLCAAMWIVAVTSAPPFLDFLHLLVSLARLIYPLLFYVQKSCVYLSSSYWMFSTLLN